MRVVRRMSSRFLSEAMFDFIISNYTTVFLWVCPQNNLRTGLSMSFQGKLATKTVLRFCWLRLPPPTKRTAFVFAHFHKMRSPLQSLTHKSFLPFQHLFHLPLQQKDNQKFRRKQECNRYKKNCVFHIFSPFRYTSIFTTTFQLSIRRSFALNDIFSGFATRIIFAVVARI